MSREEVFERLNEVFRDVFDEEDITVDEGTTAEDIDGWDSLEHINLMAAVESEFGIKFSMGQIVTMKNVDEMADIILQKVCNRELVKDEYYFLLLPVSVCTCTAVVLSDSEKSAVAAFIASEHRILFDIGRGA